MEWNLNGMNEQQSKLMLVYGTPGYLAYKFNLKMGANFNQSEWNSF
jgi:hypothetical protein